MFQTFTGTLSLGLDDGHEDTRAERGQAKVHFSGMCEVAEL